MRHVVLLVAAYAALLTPTAAQEGCHASCEGACVPVISDVNCAGSSGNGPSYARGPVYVVGPDVHDVDHDGVGCD